MLWNWSTKIKFLIRLLIQEEESTLFKIHQQVANIPIKVGYLINLISNNYQFNNFHWSYMASVGHSQFPEIPLLSTFLLKLPPINYQLTFLANCYLFCWSLSLCQLLIPVKRLWFVKYVLISQGCYERPAIELPWQRVSGCGLSRGVQSHSRNFFEEDLVTLIAFLQHEPTKYDSMEIG